MLAFVALAVLGSLWFLGGTGLAGLDDALPAAGTPAQSPAEQVERGRYLARIGNCALCHTARGGQPYAGGRAIETPFGTVMSSNLTPDKEHGLGQWSAQDFWQAMHLGQSRDGHLLYPAFPYTSFTHVSRADADALFAYLQSLQPVAQATPAHALRWPYSTPFALRIWRALYFKPASSAATESTTPLARGQYLVDGLAHCMECHGGRNALGAQSARAGGGYLLPGGQWYAPSLSDPAQASVASWSDADVQRFLQTGANDHALASGPMAEVVLHGTQYLSDADAQAMAAYLKALPQTSAKASAPAQQPASGLSALGAKVYEKHCAECHGAQGEGRAGAYPALAGNRAVTMAQTQNLVRTVLGGGFAPATAGNPQPYGMPPFMLQLGDGELAAVLTYIRSAWGNQASAISEFDINQQRRSQVP